MNRIVAIFRSWRLAPSALLGPHHPVRMVLPDRRLIEIKATLVPMPLISLRTIGVYPVISRYHDGSEHQAPAGRRAQPVRAIMILVLALLLIGLQPWNHGYSANASATGSINSAAVMSADCGGGDRDAGNQAASHCLLHAGCAVSVVAEASMLPVSYPSDWPAFIAGTDIGLRPHPDPKPPKFLA